MIDNVNEAMEKIKESIDQYRDDALINEFNHHDALWSAPHMKLNKPKIPFDYILLWAGFGLEVLLMIFSIILFIYTGFIE